MAWRTFGIVRDMNVKFSSFDFFVRCISFLAGVFSFLVGVHVVITGEYNEGLYCLEPIAARITGVFLCWGGVYLVGSAFVKKAQ